MITKKNLSEKLAGILDDENCDAGAPIEMLDIFIDVLTEEQLKKVVDKFNSSIWARANS